MTRFILSLAALVAFTAYTAVVVGEQGFSGLFALMTPFVGWGNQVLIDLVIACVLVLIWMYYDVRQQGWGASMFWPFLVLTLGSGSIGLLAYFTVRNYRLIGQEHVTAQGAT